MRYMLLIYGNEAARAAMTDAERQAEMPQWTQYTTELQQAGVLRGGDALHFTTAATTVRGPGSSAIVTDGPFAETKEALGGYYLIDAPSLDEAIEWAKKCPGAAYGAVEVRPLMDMPVPEGQ